MHIPKQYVANQCSQRLYVKNILLLSESQLVSWQLHKVFPSPSSIKPTKLPQQDNSNIGLSRRPREKTLFATRRAYFWLLDARFPTDKDNEYFAATVAGSTRKFQRDHEPDDGYLVNRYKPPYVASREQYRDNLETIMSASTLLRLCRKQPRATCKESRRKCNVVLAIDGALSSLVLHDIGDRCSQGSVNTVLFGMQSLQSIFESPPAAESRTLSRVNTD